MACLDFIESASVSAYVKVTESIRNFKTSEKAVTAVEYAIVIAGVAGIVAVIFGSNGKVASMLNSIFDNIQSSVNSSLPSSTPATGTK